MVFCGIEEADGSNLLCAHVGRSLAEQVRSQVCIVDANLRFPGVGRLFEPVPLESEQPSATMVSRKVGDNLWLFCGDSVSANSAGPTLDQLRPCIRDLDDAFAYAVINAPPIGLYNDAVLLGQMADGVVLRGGSEFHSTRSNPEGQTGIGSQQRASARDCAKQPHVPNTSTNLPFALKVLNKTINPIGRSISRRHQLGGTADAENDAFCADTVNNCARTAGSCLPYYPLIWRLCFVDDADPNLSFRCVPGDHNSFFREGNLVTTVHVNRYGWIAPEWRGKVCGPLRIAVFGDSLSEALQVQRSETASAVAERALQQRLGPGVELITFGRSGFSQTEQSFLLQTEVMRFAPDVIVDFFFPGNDIAGNVQPEHYKGCSATVLYRRSNPMADSLFDNSFNQSIAHRFRAILDPFKRRSALISLILQDYNMVRRRRAATSLQYDVEKGYLSLCTSTPDANFRASYQLNRRLLEDEAALAKRQGIPFVLVTLDNPAYQPQVAEQLRQDAPSFDPYCIENDMEKVGHDSGVYHLGLQSVFADAYSRDKIELHWPLDGHWNSAGNRVAGEALAKTLETVFESRSRLPNSSRRPASAWRN